MIPLLGTILLWAASVLGLMQASHCAVRHRLIVASGLFACLSTAFALLMYSHVISDFSVLNVFQHSHTAKPLLYKITGTWGNHEGSMLLLVIMLAAYHLAYTAIHRITSTTSLAIPLHALILLGFLGFIIATSDPFTRLTPAPNEGLDLNPLLQDIGLAIHPPLLYFGYTGFSILFVLTLESLIRGTLLDWPKYARRWLTLCWIFLTLGIIAGSWWAYRELGWGGYWFWDPVENVSLMPWLAATALLHSSIVLEKRKSFPHWTALLSILTFILCVIGIFLVRSGILTSVHSFAEDPGRGLYILGFFALTAGSALWVFSAHYKPAAATPHALVSKETGLLLNNLLLTVFCCIILLGVLYPILLQYFSQQFISVAAPYFNTMLRFVACPLLVLAIFVPALAWGQDKGIRHIKHFAPSLLLALVAAYVTKSGYLFPFLGWWLVFSTVYFVLRLPKISLRTWGMATAHIGLGFLALTLAILTSGEQEKQAMLKQGESLTVAGYTITLKEMLLYAKDNYLLRQGRFEISKDGNVLGELRPEVRFYPAREQNTTESAIYRHFLSDIYMVMGDTNGVDSFGVRCYYRPYINGIWLSGIVMALGVLLTFLSRNKKI